MKRLLRDWPFKLLALAIAVTLWAVMATRERRVVSARVPIEYVGLSSDLVLADAPRETAEVHLAVARWAVPRFGVDELRVRVNLAGSSEGERFVAVSAGDVRKPPGVRIRRVDPAQLRLRLVPAAEATLRVVPVVSGAPAFGHRVASVRVDPIAVLVRGPRSTIEMRESVETTPVDVAGRRNSVTQSVGLAFPDSVVAVSSGRVQVTVDIQAERGSAREPRGGAREPRESALEMERARK